MPIHEKDKIRNELLDDVYASSDLSVVMPKYKFPQKEHAARHAYQVLHDELMLDGNSRQNLATFCQTWIEPEIHKLMDECIDKNMIDKDEYPQSAEIENRCVHMLADLLIEDLKRCIDYFQRNPLVNKGNEKDSGNFNHS